jgi:hypothetical protein
VKPLVDLYCILPDRYEEMDQYGFIRNSPGPRSASEIRIYCVRPDGQPIHALTGDSDQDTASLVYLLERIMTNLSEQRPAEAARYTGVLAHFIEDSLSPPHAVSPDELLRLAPAAHTNFHSTIERSLPEFDLQPWTPRPIGNSVLAIATAIRDRCDAGAAMNRTNLSAIVKAAIAHDERVLNDYRAAAGTRAAQVLADVLYTLFAGDGAR